MRNRILISIQLCVVLLITVLTNGNDADMLHLATTRSFHKQARSTSDHQIISRKHQKPPSLVKIKTRFMGSDISYPADMQLVLNKPFGVSKTYSLPSLSFVYKYSHSSSQFRGPPAVSII